jgi:hypothetical protein
LFECQVIGGHNVLDTEPAFTAADPWRVSGVVLEFSEAPLDSSLFELPATYAPALRLPDGGRDLTKPDTFGNRVQVYWAALTATAHRWLP